MSIQIGQARLEDANTVATLVGELLQEIMVAVKDPVFVFHHDDTVARACSCLLVVEGRSVHSAPCV